MDKLGTFHKDRLNLFIEIELRKKKGIKPRVNKYLFIQEK